MENTSDRNRMIGVGIAGLLVGFGLGWLWFSERANVNEDRGSPLATTSADALLQEMDTENGSVSQTMTEPNETKTVGAAEYRIFVTTQTAGTQVVIAKLGLKEKAWVVIHEDSRGRPGNILGARRFEAGEYVAGVIELLRNTTPGGVYYVMIHSDNGDQTFESLSDTALTADDGSPLMERFTTAS